MGDQKTKVKIKQANKKWRHDKKRRDKSFAEKKRIANAIEKRGRKKNDRRRAEAAYVAGLGRELI